MSGDELVTREQAAQLLGLTPSGVRKYEEKRQLTLVPRAGKKGTAYYARAEVEALRSFRALGPVNVIPARGPDWRARRTSKRRESAEERAWQAQLDADTARVKADDDAFAQSEADRETLKRHKRIYEERTLDERGAAAFIALETGLAEHEARALLRHERIPLAPYDAELVLKWGGRLRSDRYDAVTILEHLRRMAERETRPTARLSRERPMGTVGELGAALGAGAGLIGIALLAKTLLSQSNAAKGATIAGEPVASTPFDHEAGTWTDGDGVRWTRQPDGCWQADRP